MTALKRYASIALGTLIALIAAPFLAFFGLIMLGLTFGMSLLAVGSVAAMAHQAETEMRMAAAADKGSAAPTQPEPVAS